MVFWILPRTFLKTLWEFLKITKHLIQRHCKTGFSISPWSCLLSGTIINSIFYQTLGPPVVGKSERFCYCCRPCCCCITVVAEIIYGILAVAGIPSVVAYLLFHVLLLLLASPLMLVPMLLIKSLLLSQLLPATNFLLAYLLLPHPCCC
jgi:hypothetical protein